MTMQQLFQFHKVIVSKAFTVPKEELMRVFKKVKKDNFITYDGFKECFKAIA